MLEFTLLNPHGGIRRASFFWDNEDGSDGQAYGAILTHRGNEFLTCKSAHAWKVNFARRFMKGAKWKITSI
jgi:hypothetical protein